MATLSGFIRVSYSELVTVIAVSLLTMASAITVVGFGAGLVAGVQTLRDVVEKRRNGIRTSERERMAAYRKTFKCNFRRAAPVGIVLWAAVVTFAWYVLAAGAATEPWLLLGALASVYALTVVLVLALRTATLLSLNDDVSLLTAAQDAGHHLLETPSFSVLYATAIVGVVGLCVALLAAVPLLLFGLLALLEVVVYAERTGEGARGIILAYQRGGAP